MLMILATTECSLEGGCSTKLCRLMNPKQEVHPAAKILGSANRSGKAARDHAKVVPITKEKGLT